MRGLTGLRSMTALAFGVALSGAAGASERIGDTARSMRDGIVSSAPLVADRSGRSSQVRRVSTGSSETAFAARLARAPGLTSFEDSYIHCVIRRALIYATATSEPSTAVAEAATAMCESERDNLVTGYRLALWGVMQVSVARVDDPAYLRAAQARVTLIDRSVTRVLTTRIVHMRAMSALEGTSRSTTPRTAQADVFTPTQTSGVNSLEWRIDSIVNKL